MKLNTISVFKDGEEYLEGEEFIRRAQAVSQLGDTEFDFYSKKENWKYLPEGVYVIIFPNTVFRGSGGSRCVRYLYSGGAEWERRYVWLGHRFYRVYLVASLASSTSTSGTQPSPESLSSLPLELIINGVIYKRQ